MRWDLLSLLACPFCKESSLELQPMESSAEEILKGTLICSLCSKTYPIKEGIPRLFLTQSKHEIDMHMKVRTANEYYHDQAAELYERDITAGQFDEFNQQRIANIVKEILVKAPNGYFLDVGCGTGNVLKHASKFFEKAVGVDVSIEMLRIARSRGLEVIQADAMYLPFGRETFGALSYFSVLHHVYDQRPLFKEANRVLATHGIIYTDWDPMSRGNAPSRAVTMTYKFLRVLYRIPQIFTRPRSIRHHGKQSDLSMKVDFRSLRPETKEIYKLAEFHHPGDGLEKDGINFKLMKEYLQSSGFADIRPTYHWNGKPTESLRPNERLKLRVLQIIRYYPRPFAENIMILGRKCA